MFYVYLIKSIKNYNKTYIGYTNNLKERLEKHNSGGSIYTDEDRPWELIMYLGFSTQKKQLNLNNI